MVMPAGDTYAVSFFVVLPGYREQQRGTNRAVGANRQSTGQLLFPDVRHPYVSNILYTLSQVPASLGPAYALCECILWMSPSKNEFLNP